MPSGGARPGAGRKRGFGNKVNEKARAEVALTGETPLQYMMRVYRDPKASLSRRDAMARAAAPYVHAQLKSVEIAGKEGAEPVRFEMVNRPAKKEAKSK